MNEKPRRGFLGGAILAAPLVGATWLGCVDVAQERAYRDDTIGKGAAAETTFEVVDGLGALRQLEPGAVSIWAQAPSFQIKVTRGERAPSAWTLTVTNTLADAVLEVRTEAGTTAIVPESLPRTLPVEKRWELMLAGGTTTLLVRPARGEPVGPWRFALLSDVQEAINRVQDIYARMNADPAISFVVSAGDLTEQGTVAELERFQHELARLRVPFFSTLGNHELGTERGAPFQRYFGRANFSFAYGGMQFTFLDSASATIDPLVYDWLEGWLAQGRSRTHAALMHIPPIDPIGVRNGSFASRNEASKLLAQLAEGGVDLTLYGHIHSYYAFSNAGMPAYISGGGGSIPERFDGIGRHYLTVDVDPVGGVTQTAIVRIDRD
jgi:3',5'-cyclic-AMP phosphodiesterase